MHCPPDSDTTNGFNYTTIVVYFREPMLIKSVRLNEVYQPGGVQQVGAEGICTAAQGVTATRLPSHLTPPP